MAGDHSPDAGMQRIGIVILLVLAHLAVTLTVPSTRAAKAFVPPAAAELSVARAAAPRVTQPTNICRLGAGLLACPYYAPVAPAAALPAEAGMTSHPRLVERLPSSRSTPTPMRPPRLSA